MNWAFEITLKNRAILKSFIDNYSLEQLNRIPEGFNNNLIWNIAHTVVTQQLLVYRLSGLSTIINEELIESYKKGTRPLRDVSQAEVDIISGLLFSTIEKTKEDFDNGVFINYNEYTVTTKSTITNVLEAIEFNNFHEGLHLGYILSLKNLV